MSRCARCRNHHYDVEQKFFCRLGHQDVFSMQKDEGECPDFKSRYLEFPLAVQGIELRGCLPSMREVGKLVRVRLCDDDKTYLGVYLGELARAPMAYTRSDSQNLIVSLYQNPALYVPACPASCGEMRVGGALSKVKMTSETSQTMTSPVNGMCDWQRTCSLRARQITGRRNRECYLARKPPSAGSSRS